MYIYIYTYIYIYIYIYVHAYVLINSTEDAAGGQVERKESRPARRVPERHVLEAARIARSTPAFRTRGHAVFMGGARGNLRTKILPN